MNAPTIPPPFNVTKHFIKDEVASSADPDLTPLMMQFGQFLDHDLTLSAEESGGDACLKRRYLSIMMMIDYIETHLFPTAKADLHELWTYNNNKDSYILNKISTKEV